MSAGSYQPAERLLQLTGVAVSRGQLTLACSRFSKGSIAQFRAQRAVRVQAQRRRAEVINGSDQRNKIVTALGI